MPAIERCCFTWLTQKKKGGLGSPPKRYSSLGGNPDERSHLNALGGDPARRWGERPSDGFQ
jgi:hypothetical protein